MAAVAPLTHDLGELGALRASGDVEQEELREVGDPRHSREVDPVGVVARPVVIAMGPGEGEENRDILQVERLLIARPEAFRHLLELEAGGLGEGIDEGFGPGVVPVP